MSVNKAVEFSGLDFKRITLWKAPKSEELESVQFCF